MSFQSFASTLGPHILPIVSSAGGAFLDQAKSHVSKRANKFARSVADKIFEGNGTNKKRKMEQDMEVSSSTQGVGGVGGLKGSNGGTGNLLVQPIPRPLRMNKITVCISDSFWAKIESGQIYADMGDFFPKGLFSSNQVNSLFFKYGGYSSTLSGQERNPIAYSYKILGKPKFRMSNIIFNNEDLDQAGNIQLQSASQMNYIIALNIGSGMGLKSNEYLIANYYNTADGTVGVQGINWAPALTWEENIYQPTTFNNSNPNNLYGRTFQPLVNNNSNTAEATIDNLFLLTRNHGQYGRFVTTSDYADDYLYPNNTPSGNGQFGYQYEANTAAKILDVNNVTSYNFNSELRNIKGMEFFGQGEVFEKEIETHLEGVELGITQSLVGSSTGPNIQKNSNFIHWSGSVMLGENEYKVTNMYPDNKINLVNRRFQNQNAAYPIGLQKKKYRTHTFFMMNPIRKGSPQSALQKASAQVFIEKSIWIEFSLDNEYGIETDDISTAINQADTSAANTKINDLYYLPKFYSHDSNGSIYSFRL